MQQYLIICLCIFTILFISTEARYCGPNSGYDNSGNSNSGYSNSGQSNSAYSSNGYNSNGNGGGGLNSGGYGNSGYGNSGYGNSEYGSRRTFTRIGNKNMYNSAYVPHSCPGCKINNLGNGDHNTHTFNLPKGIFD